MRFPDRREAGRLLSRELMAYAGRGDVVVLGLPRGGVVVAAEVAEQLAVPMDICVVRKLGVPGHEELAMGAVASGGVRYLNHELLSHLSISRAVVDRVTGRELRELERRERCYRGDRPALGVEGKTIILVDDGLATGATVKAAVAAVRSGRPAHLIVAAPTASRSAKEEVGGVADECLSIITPEPFHAVGLWYDDFRQTTDEEVAALLAFSALRGKPSEPVAL